ncbi:Ribosomal RNA small subunit methyltransferase A [Buchnera aphidicola (Eriosoma grossulariae)]
MKKKLYLGHFPSKFLGQNFLINQIIIDQIVHSINPKLKDILVEIGPGLGALTKKISGFVDELIVIEVDPNLINKLKKYKFSKKLKIFLSNVLYFNFLNLFNKKKNIRIFGNLPYNISTEIIIYLTQFSNIIDDMNFMLQKEVANRLLAKPNTKSYGRLSVIVQYFFNVNFLFNIHSESFFPIPKVQSSFLKFIPHIDCPYFLKNIDTLSFVTKIAFNQRRKIILNSLRGFFNSCILNKLGISPFLRAENISVEQYCVLANYIYDHKLYK